MKLIRFAAFSLQQLVQGGPAYYAWIAILLALIALGLVGYGNQAVQGHIVANLRDPVPWGIFIGTYAFFVGVAAAAVALVVPGYLYGWKPIKEIVILGEIVAISAVVVAILFVMADLGHPERFLHLVPIIGTPNVPTSMVGSNVLILNSYLVLNLIIVTYVLYCAYVGRPYNSYLMMMLMIISVPLAISIHATTALIFSVLPSRPFWNSAILVPRFISTALCSGPAIMLIAFQLVRKAARLDIKDEALLRIAEIMTHVMGVNLLLFLAEVITEFRSATEHSVHAQYYFQGLEGHIAVVPFAWVGVVCSLLAFVVFLIPRMRKNFVTLNIGCVLAIAGVFIEKGIGLILPGFVPGTLGEVYEYTPAPVEIAVALGVVAAGALVFTLCTKVAIPLALSELRRPYRRFGGLAEEWAPEIQPVGR
jgi:molybdopterin-containing oxidoreductase family membrane subunit